MVLSQTGDWRSTVKEFDISSAAIALIIFGAVVFLISFFGCCGAIKESYCMTMTYASVLFVIFIAQVVIAVLVIVNKEDVRAIFVKALGELWENPGASGNKGVITAIQRQVRIDCFVAAVETFNSPLVSSFLVQLLRVGNIFLDFHWCGQHLRVCRRIWYSE